MRETVIVPDNSWRLLHIREILEYKELFFVFVWRDIKVRYKQTFLGVLWVVFQPLVSMAIFTFFFGKLANISSGNLPYSLFVLIGMVYWTFFSTAVSFASASMIENERIIQKIYFPKILLPLSSIATACVDFFITFLLAVFFGAALGYYPTVWFLLVFPITLALTILSASGLSLFFAALNVKYRDVRYILPFFIQLFLFVTPIIYPLSIVSERNKVIMALNPMSGVVEYARFLFSDGYRVEPNLLVVSFFSAIVLFFLGLWYFTRTQQFFADIV